MCYNNISNLTPFNNVLHAKIVMKTNLFIELNCLLVITYFAFFTNYKRPETLLKKLNQKLYIKLSSFRRSPRQIFSKKDLLQI